MKKTIVPAVILFLSGLMVFSSCGGFKLSQTEQAAVDSVVNQYAATSYKWKKLNGFHNSTRQNTFQLELKGSPLVEKFSDNPEPLVTGIALNLYSQFGESKSKYDLIQIRIIQGNDYKQWEFKSKDLQEVETYLTLLNQTMEQVNDNRYSEFYSNVEQKDTSLKLMKEEDLKIICDMSDSLIGDYQETVFFSYGFLKNDDPKLRFLKLTSTVKGTKSLAYFNLIISQDTGKIVGISFS